MGGGRDDDDRPGGRIQQTHGNIPERAQHQHPGGSGDLREQEGERKCCNCITELSKEQWRKHDGGHQGGGQGRGGHEGFGRWQQRGECKGEEHGGDATEGYVEWVGEPTIRS